VCSKEVASTFVDEGNPFGCCLGGVPQLLPLNAFVLQVATYRQPVPSALTCTEYTSPQHGSQVLLFLLCQQRSLPCIMLTCLQKVEGGFHVVAS